MVKLLFSQPKNRTAHAGLSNGVIYMGTAAYVWDGLKTISAREYSNNGDYIYLDGQPIDSRRPTRLNEFGLTCYTYPDQLQVGYNTPHPGVGYYTGTQKPFDLSWRTAKVSDLRTSYVYHFLLNCTTTMNGYDLSSNSGTDSFSDFVFNLRSYPKPFDDKTLSYFWIDGSTLNDNGVEILEGKLYGTASTRPEIPTFEWIKNLISANPYNEIEGEFGLGRHRLQVGIGDDVQGNVSVGLFKIKDTTKIEEVSPGIYRYS